MRFSAFLPKIRSAALCAAAAAVLTLGCAGTAQAAPTAAEKQAEAQAALASLNAMQSVLDKASNDYFTALDEQARAEQDAEQAQQQIDEASAEIAAMQERLGSRAHSMYVSGPASFIDLLLGATSWDEFTTRWDMLVDVNRSDAELIDRAKELRAEVEEQKAVLDERTRTAREKAAEAERIQQEAQETTEAMRQTYDSLSAEAAELLEQEREAQRLAEEAAAEEAATLQPSAGSANAGSQGTSSAPAPSVPSSGSPYNPVTGNAIVDRAYSCLGAAYVWGACSPGAFDCSGLVSYAVSGSYTRLGTTYTFLGWPQVFDPQPGDIAVNADHCGVYIGNGQMIHAATEGVGVIVGGVQAGMIFVRP